MGKVMNDEKIVTLFDVSGQRWKLAVMVMLIILLVANAIVHLVGVPGTRVEPAGGAAGGATLGTVFAILDVAIPLTFCVWFLFVLRCPKCGRSIVWYIARKEKLRDYNKKYDESMKRGCPACGVKYKDLLEERAR